MVWAAVSICCHALMNFVSGVVFDRWSEAWFDCSQCSIQPVTICDCFSSGKGRNSPVDEFSSCAGGAE